MDTWIYRDTGPDTLMHGYMYTLMHGYRDPWEHGYIET